LVDALPELERLASTPLNIVCFRYVGQAGQHSDETVKEYEPLGGELLNQVKGPIHAFCGSVGTGEMLMEVARVLRQAGSTTRIVALEPDTSAVISGGKRGAHDVEGKRNRTRR
jgi:cysteine synthase